MFVKLVSLIVNEHFNVKNESMVRVRVRVTVTLIVLFGHQ